MERILAPLITTVKKYQMVKNMAQKVRGPSSGTIYRRNNTPEWWKNISIRNRFMDFRKTIEVRTTGNVVKSTIEELARKNVIMHYRKVLVDIDILDRRGRIRR